MAETGLTEEAGSEETRGGARRTKSFAITVIKSQLASDISSNCSMLPS